MEGSRGLGAKEVKGAKGSKRGKRGVLMRCLRSTTTRFNGWLAGDCHAGQPLH